MPPTIIINDGDTEEIIRRSPREIHRVGLPHQLLNYNSLETDENQSFNNSVSKKKKVKISIDSPKSSNHKYIEQDEAGQ